MPIINTSGGGKGARVTSVNGRSGAISLTDADVLDDAQILACNSGITASKVASYDSLLGSGGLKIKESRYTITTTGSTPTVTLTELPEGSVVDVFVNGLLCDSDEYTVSGLTVTVNLDLLAGQKCTVVVRSVGT